MISLILLLILTIIGLSAIQTTTIEERMAGNMRDSEIAFQSSEAAIRDAENFIDGTVSITAFNDANGLFNSDDTDGTAEPDFTLKSTWTSNTTSRVIGTQVPGLSATNQPRYFIKHVGTVTTLVNSSRRLGSGRSGGASAGVEVFRITAKGFGASGKSQVVIRTYYGKRY